MDIIYKLLAVLMFSGAAYADCGKLSEQEKTFIDRASSLISCIYGRFDISTTVSHAALEPVYESAYKKVQSFQWDSGVSGLLIFGVIPYENALYSVSITDYGVQVAKGELDSKESVVKFVPEAGDGVMLLKVVSRDEYKMILPNGQEQVFTRISPK